MMATLTFAGIALCVALTGVQTPTYEQCDLAILKSEPVCDEWMRCPEAIESRPDDMAIPEGCMAIARYDIYDGSKGTEWLCHHDATLVWLSDGRWAWEFAK